MTTALSVALALTRTLRAVCATGVINPLLRLLHQQCGLLPVLADGGDVDCIHNITD